MAARDLHTKRLHRKLTGAILCNKKELERARVKLLELDVGSAVTKLGQLVQLNYSLEL